MRRAPFLLTLVLAILLASACAQNSTQLVSAKATAAPVAPIDLAKGNLKPTDLSVEEAVQPGEEDALFLGAGDISRCDDKDGTPQNGDMETGDLVLTLLAKFPDATVFAAGDNAYEKGSAVQFHECYGPTWGRFLKPTAPVPGNHEYYDGARDAAAYFDYFNGTGKANGPAGERGKGYYSFDRKDWHIVALNSELFGHDQEVQRTWLEEDLKTSRQRCTLAYWHRPLFSSGRHGAFHLDPLNGRYTKVYWDILEGQGADVVINGHDHDYERFKPLNSKGDPAPLGIREFVVGTGGGDQRDLHAIQLHSVAQLANQYGILVLTLQPDSYSWIFLGTDGKVYDPGSSDAPCHDKPALSKAPSGGAP